MYQRASAGGGGSDWYNVILLTTAPGAAITITDGDEEIEATGTGSQQAIAIHDESATYTISVAVNGFTKPGTNVLTGTTSGIIFEREVAFAEVTLTYDDDFRSETGTISDGTTTANYTFPASDNETAIYIPSTGTWNVYCTVSGEQYKSSDIVVTSLSDSYTSDIHVRPDGKTVTPTDDIQTWLECGGIKGKSYTTLDEVLADHETLQKLISDENAVDYMVRSKTWIKQITVPTMTSDTAPSGKVTYSGQLSGYNGWKAFNPSESFGWLPDSGSSYPQWLDYEFDKPTCIKHIDLSQLSASDVGRTFDFVAYDTDASSPTVLAENITITGNDVFTFYFSNSTSYKHYRLIFKSSTHSSITAGSGIKLQFYSLADHGITEDETAMRYIGKRNYAADTLLDDVNPGLVPVKTADDANVLKSSEYNGQEAYKAFNDDTSGTSSTYTCWSASDASVPQYIGYKFDSLTIIKSFGIRERLYSGAATLKGRLEASNDGFVSDINDLTGELTWNSMVTSNPKWQYFDINNSTAYESYRLYITYNSGGSSYHTTVEELQFFAKPYYEPRWLDGICDSEYFESVLNAKVPVMTSDTTPSGVAFSSGVHATETQYQAYMGFRDNTDDNGWESNYSTPYVAGTYVPYLGYDFGTGKQIKVVKSQLNNFKHGGSYRRLVDYKVQGSNVGGSDPNDWTDLCSNTYPNQVDGIVYDTFANANKYRFYRFWFTGNNNSWWVAAKNCNFYGREDVDESKIDVYGAAGAAVSYKNGNSWSPLTTLENDGHKQIAKSALPVGVTELEMKTDVANNPDDLTADFSKIVNIFDQMIEMWLTPVDDPLYWYGYKGNIEIANTANGWSISSGYSYYDGTFNTTNAQTAVGQYHGFSTFGTKKPVKCTKASCIATGTNPIAQHLQFITLSPDKSQVLDPTASAAPSHKLIKNGLGFYDTEPVADLKDWYVEVTAEHDSSAQVTLHGLWTKSPNPASNFFSAAKDTVYYTQGGVDIVVAKTDDFGGAIVDLTKIPDGVTLYSSVAKDPDSLATTPAAYSKVYHEPVSGKFYLMPDNTIYWYGWEGSGLGFDANTLYSTGATASKQKNQNSLQIDGTGTGTGIQGQAMSLTEVIDLTGFSKFSFVGKRGSDDYGGQNSGRNDYAYIIDGILASIGWAGSETPKHNYFTPSPTFTAEEIIGWDQSAGVTMVPVKTELTVASNSGSLAIVVPKYVYETPRQLIIDAIYLES